MRVRVCACRLMQMRIDTACPWSYYGCRLSSLILFCSTSCRLSGYQYGGGGGPRHQLMMNMAVSSSCSDISSTQS